MYAAMSAIIESVVMREGYVANRLVVASDDGWARLCELDGWRAVGA